LISVLLAQGATRSAALVPRLLRLETLPADSLTKDVLLTLQSRGYLDGNTRYSAKYRDLCSAWMAVLQGSSRDFAACGTTTLDRFGADLLAALLAVPATRADELRRGLRKAGIAAFGVLEAA
jgi:aspartokinase